MKNLKYLKEIGILNNKFEERAEYIIKKYDIALKELFLLEVLFTYEDIKVTEIDQHIYWSRSSASLNLRSLEKKGLIIKHRQLHDERVVKVNLSTEGLVIIGKIKAEIENDNEIDQLVNNFLQLKNSEISKLNYSL